MWQYINWPHARSNRISPGTPQTVRNCLGKLVPFLLVLIAISIWLQFVVGTDLSGQTLTRDGVWHVGEVSSSRMNPRPHSTGQMGDGLGERFANVRVADRMARGQGGVCYGQWTQASFIDLGCRKMSWQDPDPVLCHSSTAITSCYTAP